MNTLRLMSLLTGLLCLLSACKDDSPDYYHQKTFEVSDFTGISFGANFRIEVSEGDTFSLIAQGENSDLEALRLEVQQGVLKGTYREGSRNHKQTLIQIQMPELQYVQLEGMASARISTFEHTTEEMYIRMEGDTRLELQEESESLEAEVNGTSELSLSGAFSAITADISGKSKLDAYEASADVYEIQLSGISEADIRVNQSLTGSVGGKSILRYKGQPTILEVEVEALSKMIHEVE